MQGFSPRNLKSMRAFATAWPDRAIVQAALARITWYHNIALLERLDDAETRLWYARQTVQHGWSRNILAVQIDKRAHERHGKAISNFEATLPPADSDTADQAFKDPYLFDFLGTAGLRREREVEPLEEQDRRRVRAPQPRQAHRCRRVGNQAVREAPEGSAGQPADGGRDRGRAQRERHKENQRAEKAPSRPEGEQAVTGALWQTMAGPCEHLVLPRPASVNVTPRSLFDAARAAARFMPFPRRGRGFKRVCVHVDLRFDESVSGPVLLGVGRYYGIGLCWPCLLEIQA
jgi:CRISPR-associated protein Csb2